MAAEAVLAVVVRLAAGYDRQWVTEEEADTPSVQDSSGRDWSDEHPPLLSPSIYLVWAVAGLGLLLAPVVVLSVSGEDAQGIEELYAGGFVLAVLISALLAYRIEARARSAYELRTSGLDLAACIAAGSIKMDSIDEVRGIERTLVNCGSYDDAAAVAEARRQAELAGRNR